ncbi:Spy/CpxP family protein refolding chaperone [Rheinheimera sp.]|uniref:Spy/CpxP family protein refolding chaperone n=1 Tax=Rheinheimera sp. TaxID=1869214 RepID=UPI00307D28BC
MKAKTLTALLFSTLVAATSLTATAGQDRGHHGPLPGPVMQLKGLDLTEAQKAQVKTLMEQHRASLPAKAGMKAQHQQLKTLIQAENFDEAAVRAELESQQKQRLEAEISRARLQHDIYQLLTAEQKAKLAEREQKRESRLQG